MPFIIPVIIAAVAYAAGYIALSTFVVIAISAALTAVAQLLMPKPSPQAATQGGASLDPGAKITGNAADTPRQIVYGRTRVNGTVVFQTTTAGERVPPNINDFFAAAVFSTPLPSQTGNVGNAILHLVVALADHECEAIDEVWFGDTKVWTLAGGKLATKYAPHLTIFPHLGASDQAANSNLMGWAPGLWSSAHRLRGVTYVYMPMSWNREVFQGFSPQNIWCVVKGKKLYDPRNGHTEWSANPSLAVADYLASARHGVGAAYGTEIDNTVLAAAASICDESVTAGGVTEKRFTLNGVIQLDQKPIDVIGGMLGAMAGRVVFSSGKWRVAAAAWSTPVLSFDENDLRGGFTVQNLLGRRNSFNSAKGSYVNPAKLWQADTFPSVVAQPYIDADGGEQSWKSISLPFTDSPVMAQRISVIDLRRQRQSLSMMYPCKLSGWRATVGDVVQISNTRLGWSLKPFEVVNATLVFEKAESGQATVIGVDLDLRETAQAIYADDVVIVEKIDPAPNTGLPDTFNVLPASNVRASEALYSSRDGGGVKAKWTIAWDASPDAFVQSGGFYRVAYRLVGASTWTALTDTTALSADVLDIQPGTYEAAVIAYNWAGGPAPAVALGATPVTGLSAPPAAPSGLTVAASNGVAVARWTMAPDLDVLQGGSIVFRHSSLSTGATWDTAVSIADPMAGNLSAAVLPLKAGTYLAKFVDASGNYSTTAAAFVQQQVSLLVFSALDSVVEDPAFAGVKSSMVVESAALRLGAAGLFDDVPDVDAVASWDWYGGVASSGTYDFADTIDLGTVRSTRVTGFITSQVVNVFDLVDSRTGEVDDWPSWDGEVTGNEADAVLFVSSTQTNPSGMSPTWSDWQRLDANDFSARGFRFQLRAASQDNAFSIYVTALDAVAEGV